MTEYVTTRDIGIYKYGKIYEAAHDDPFWTAQVSAGNAVALTEVPPVAPQAGARVAQLYPAEPTVVSDVSKWSAIDNLFGEEE